MSSWRAPSSMLAAMLGSKIYAGLKPGINRAQLESAIQQGRCEDCLHSFHAQAGDCVYLSAGTVHSLGAGILVAEIQQSSDTTFRLFDWNRLGPEGKSRPLHIEQALNVIDYKRGPVNPQQPQVADIAGASRLVAGEKFVLDRRTFDTAFQIGGNDRCHILIVLEGSLNIRGDPAPVLMTRGSTVLLPACLGRVQVEPQNRVVVLEAFLPD